MATSRRESAKGKPSQEFAAKYGVRNIPTVLVFQNGEVVGRQVGVAPKNAYAEAIDALL